MKKLSFLLILLSIVGILLGQIVLNEDFSTGIPEGWTIEVLGDPGLGWEWNSNGYIEADSDAAGSGAIHLWSTITTSAIDCSGLSNMILELNHYYRHLGSSYGKILISTNNQDWTLVQEYNATYGTTEYPLETIYISEYADGESTVYLRFEYDDAGGWNWYWRIANMMIYSPAPEPMPAVLVAPANNANDVLHNQNLMWQAGGGAIPTGYKMYFGTTANPGFVADLGNVTTWTPVPVLVYSTTYYWKVVPYNAEGDAQDCPVWTFTTRDDPTQPMPFFEDFEGVTTGLPLDWTGNMNVMANHGTDGSNGVSKNIWSAAPAGNVKSPIIGPVLTGTVLKFDYRIVNWSGYPGTATPLEPGNTVEIKVNGEVAYTISSENHTVTTNFAEVSFDISDFAGQLVDVEWVCTWVSGDYYVDIDNVKIFLPVDYDLIAMSISGPIMPTVGMESVYTVRIKNDGLLPASGYTVKLMQGTTELASATGAEIAPQTITNIDLAWTPTTQGEFDIHGIVEFAADMNPGNNITDIMTVDVQPEGTAIAYIGNPNSTSTANIPPLNYYYKNSVSQSLYLDDEIQVGGLIEVIAYRFTGHGDIPAETPIAIYMAITDQEVFASTSDWVPYEEFQLVYEGSLPVSDAGTYDILISLDTPFPYGGGNLVIMAHRPMDPNPYYNFNNKFQVTGFAGVNRTLTLSADSNEYDLQALPAGSFSTNVANTSLVFNTAGLGSVTGVVTHNSQPLADVEVRIAGTNRRTITNAEGAYTLNYIPEGNVTLTATKHGFYNYTSDPVNVVEDGVTTHNFAMTQLPTVTVSGTILASDTGAGLAGANITLTGYENYGDITSNAQGQFEIPGVYSTFTYTIRVIRDGYQTYVDDNIEVGTVDLALSPITLEELANPPRNVIATATESAATISWNSPSGGAEVEFRYDDGVVTGQLGFPSGNENSVMGAVHRHNATLNEMSWFLTTEAGTYSSVKVWVIGLDAAGLPDRNQILFSQANVPFTLGEWNTFTFPNPVDAPNGFLVGLSASAFLGLATDDGIGPEYPFVPSTQFGVFDITDPSSAFTDISFWEFQVNYLIRATGIDNGELRTFDNNSYASLVTPKDEVAKKSRVDNIAPVYNRLENEIVTNFTSLKTTQSRALTHYSLYRADVDQLDNPNLWTLIDGNISDTTFVDNLWATVESGEYKYVVHAIYTNNVSSVPAFSNPVSKNMTAQVTVNITTENGGAVNGALVRLINNNGNPNYIYQQTATGQSVIFPEVWKGTYTLSVQLAGYVDYINNNLVVQENQVTVPVNLLVSNYAVDDDFESYDSFALEFGQWTLIDGDMSATYGFTGISFPNSGSPMAYIIFVPSETSPALDYTPNSGSKMAASFASTSAVNNDYMITPAINVGLGAYIKFWAASYTDQYGLERFRVLAGTTNNPAQMTVLTPGAYVEAPTQWTEFMYPLDDFAGLPIYVAINCVSDDAFIFFVDDVLVETGESIDGQIPTPRVTQLSGNYPNPFNPTTSIKFEMAKQGHVELEIFNIKGQRVKTLVNDIKEPGFHEVVWTGKDSHNRNVGSGVYFYRMKTGTYTSTKKMLLVK